MWRRCAKWGGEEGVATTIRINSTANQVRAGVQVFGLDFAMGPRSHGRCSRARALPHYKWRADTFKRVAETGPRLANVVEEGRLGLTDFLPEVEK
jgi:hypothetical protein